MNCRIHQTVMVLSLALLVVHPATTSAGPPNPTLSDAANNTAGGTDALLNTTANSASSNTAFGALALRANMTGSFNTATSEQALIANTTGSNNTATGVGAGAGSLLTSGSNNIYLGHSGLASESATRRLGSVQTRAFIKGVAGMPLSGKYGGDQQC
jgi:hypothetical protein